MAGDSAVGNILYVRRRTGWPLSQIVKMWLDAKRSPKVGTIGYDGYPVTPAHVFFYEYACARYGVRGDDDD